MAPSSGKSILAKLLGFAWFYLPEYGLFIGLRQKTEFG
jgi:hypothetical protein